MTPPGQSTTSTNAMCEACTGRNLKLIYEYRNIYTNTNAVFFALSINMIKRVYEGINNMNEKTDLYMRPLCCSSFPSPHT